MRNTKVVPSLFHNNERIQSMRRSRTQPRYMVDRVQRHDADHLYNAVEIGTGREYDQTPTHSRELAQELVARLNRLHGRRQRGSVTTGDLIMFALALSAVAAVIQIVMA